MSAELLRRAAALMRERAAEASGTGGSPGPWCPDWTYTAIRHVQRNCDIECPVHGDDEPCDSFGRYAGPHIASWHPAVALAVAALLDDGADYLDYMVREHPEEPANEFGQYYLAVVRAYLGEDA